MKTRALWYSLFVGVVSMTSGCCCFREAFPNVGWRFHQGATCSPCAPACGPACSPGPAYRPPVVMGAPGPDCPSCGISGPSGYPTAFTQPVGYPPEIGQPVPLPGPKVVPGTELPNPMPVNPKTGN
ncbi:unnamed protein product [Gemmataceae bacterium]|nr:unnamed protein product [Gemmataceae bacterium]VTU00355.1 unnamed protein product [Gemmataceae bacterium]